MANQVQPIFFTLDPNSQAHPPLVTTTGALPVDGALRGAVSDNRESYTPDTAQPLSLTADGLLRVYVADAYREATFDDVNFGGDIWGTSPFGGGSF